MSTPRHQAREAALGALYLWEMGKTDPVEALNTFFSEHAADASDSVREFASQIVIGTSGATAELDALISRHIEHWRVERLAVIDRLILRMAAWELQHETDTPPAVVLNEALELARTFSTDDSVRFVNGVLDSISRALKENDGK